MAPTRNCADTSHFHVVTIGVRLIDSSMRMTVRFLRRLNISLRPCTERPTSRRSAAVETCSLYLKLDTINPCPSARAMSLLGLRILRCSALKLPSITNVCVNFHLHYMVKKACKFISDKCIKPQLVGILLPARLKIDTRARAGYTPQSQGSRFNFILAVSESMPFLLLEVSPLLTNPQELPIPILPAVNMCTSRQL